MNRTSHLLAVLGLCCALAACGGGGGGASSPGAGAETPAASDGPGQRQVPGYSLSATRRTAVAAGAACTVRISITPQSGQQAVTAMEVWIGHNDYAEPASTTPATPVAGLTNTWDLTTTLPNPLPADATIWLRLTTADGSIIEVGRDAFQIATLPTG